VIAQAVPPPTDTTGAEPPLRVLVIDDDPDINRLLQLRMRARGYDVVSAANGAEGLEAIDRFRPDLIVCDVSMPVMDGLEFLDQVRGAGHDVAVVVATAFGSETVAIEALRRGADDYLRKPLEPVEFQAVLDRTVARLLLARENRKLREQLDEKRRQLEAELARAAVQAHLLPREEPLLPGWDVAAVCQPAREVGGDFFDWQVDGDTALTVTLGDVMGKGMAAALLMATVRAALRAVAPARGPSERVAAVGRGLAADLDRSGSFITLFHAQIDGIAGDIRYVDAGHGLALVRRADGGVEPLRGPEGPPLGIETGTVYAEGQARLAPGDTLLIYSDGLPDARPDLGSDPTLLGPYLAGGSARMLVDRLVTLADEAGQRPDDLTVVAVRRRETTMTA